MTQGEQQQKSIAKELVPLLHFQGCPDTFYQHIAGMIMQQPPSNPQQLFELIEDFLIGFKLSRQESGKACQNVFKHLTSQGLIHPQNKFHLNAQKLDSQVVLQSIMSLNDPRKAGGKRRMAGNSNDEMMKWKKKEKRVKDDNKNKQLFLRHVEDMQKQQKQLPPVVVRHARAAEGGKNNDLILDRISVVVGGKALLEETNVKLGYGRKYGLVGRNGIGKTCFMNALARGEFAGMPKHLQILLVEQEIKQTEKSVLQTVLETDIQREQLMKELEDGEKNNISVQRITEINSKLESIEAHKAQSRASSILAGLGFTNAMFSRPISSLSGGWRVRVALARALFVKPDILLLDEPTNHLDLDAVMWLQDYITNICKNTVVVVSHARQFLNVTCTDIIHFFQQKLVYYKGNYDTYERTRSQRNIMLRRQHQSQQMKLAHMQTFIDKFRYNAKRASLVQSRIKAMEKMELVEEVIEDPTCVFIFPTPDKLRPPLLKVEDGNFMYEEGKAILRNINLAVDMETRMAIVGANGAGKSTLLKLLVGKLQLTEGNQYRNGRLIVEIFTQHHVDQLKLVLSPLEQFMEDFPGHTQQAYRNHLGSFGVTGNLALRPQYLLSGGQKSRVAFAMVVWRNPHILVLDEPTNHLDIDAVNALIIALNNYKGGVVIVSHDQHLIATVCDQIWYIKDSRFKKFNGDFEDYRRALAMGKL